MRFQFQFRDHVFSSPPQEIEKRPELIYENLDGAFNDVGFCPLKLRASLPVYQTSNHFELRVVPSTIAAAEKAAIAAKESKPKRWFGGEDDTTLERASETLRAKHSEKAKKANSKLMTLLWVKITTRNPCCGDIVRCLSCEPNPQPLTSGVLRPAQALRRATHADTAHGATRRPHQPWKATSRSTPGGRRRAPDGTAPRSGLALVRSV